MAVSQEDRIINLTTVLGDDVLLPEFVAGVEGISELFYYHVEMIADVATTIEPKDIIGTKITISIMADDDGTFRYINGIVASFESCGGDEEFNNYRAYVVPNVWLATLGTNTRVFQDKTVTDVVEQVLKDYGISTSIKTSGTYTPMEYCTQYRETDFAFISRLLEQHGILYYFEHTDSDHTFTLQDNSTKLADCPVQDTFRYSPSGHQTEGFYDFVISNLNAKTNMTTGKFTAWDYSFIRYKSLPDPLSGTNSAGPLPPSATEQYDYADSAAAYLKKIGSDGTISPLATFFQQMRVDAEGSEAVIVEGTSNAICMQTGFSFSLTDYSQSAINGKYLLTRVEHSVRQTPPYRARGTSSVAPYNNSFTAIPFATLFRPQRKTRKPAVHGMHTGKVVVPSGEDSYMDKYGRVCVQFFWDRLRKANTPDNTLLRVAQSWAGKGWGTYFWPRVDDEVLIDFIEGDPDQPIVVGSVYNGVNMPKYDPAGQYTLSGILTRSSKDGGAANANELRFEDLKGKEQIFMNAEKDYDLHVENDHHTLIGANQHETIGADQLVQISGESHLTLKKKLYEEIDDEVHQHLKAKQVVKLDADRHESIGTNTLLKVGSDSNIDIGQDLNEKVGMNYSLNVGMNQNNKIGTAYAVDAGQTVYIKGGMTLVIEGGMGICMKGPGGFVSIDPSGVTIQGMLVKINSGGAALSGSPAQTTDPQAPDSPTAPKAPSFPGDAPPSQAASSSAGAAATTPKATTAGSSAPASSSPPPPAAASSSSPTTGAPAAAPAAPSQGAAQAAQAASQAQQAASQAQQAVQQTEQQSQQAVSQVTNTARQAYQQASQAVQQAQQLVGQAAGPAQQMAQQALGQAEQQAMQAAQAASQAVQQAQQQAQQNVQQAQQAANQAQQQAQAAQQAAQQAASQGQQQAQQAAQQAQQAAQGAQKAAQQAQQQAQQAAQQVTQASSQATQQAQQAAQGAQKAASQAISSLPKGL